MEADPVAQGQMEVVTFIQGRMEVVTRTLDRDELGGSTVFTLGRLEWRARQDSLKLEYQEAPQ